METPPPRTARRKTKQHAGEEDSAEPLIDTTQALTLRSKRTERRLKKVKKKEPSVSGSGTPFLDLPYELLVPILSQLRPSDLFVLSQVCKPLRNFIQHEGARLSETIISRRYACLAKCFLLPVPLQALCPNQRTALIQRNAATCGHTQPQNIPQHDRNLVCSCLSCALRWNCLCLVVDFAYWQDNLDKGQPIPMVARGSNCVPWNTRLLARNAAMVTKCLASPLWYARVLEAHLDSTIRSILRHSQNKGNRRSRFRMTTADVAAGTDEFLERSGPPSAYVPYHRDNYYLLEAFLPNRSWIKEKQGWIYLRAEQHDKDLDIIVRFYTPLPLSTQEGI
ncbi:hypothetical protein QBC46DRAFT_390813 [Diplogelasinospora grovesii]|uniref:F-box domain-containing protein n=1 Tax=Diplogelasinospora grovesii TaxID=303347 RepID=A0AAN6N2X5_9PEZI|nr:hypothetical protein QBC46DRAFT_390813 [Diplogelasinospora grovesii]